MSAYFQTEVQDDCINVFLKEKVGLLGKKINNPYETWVDKISDSQLPILTVLNGLLESENGKIHSDNIELPHKAIIGLSESQAHFLGLPSAVPFALDIKAHGTIDQDNFKLGINWVNAGGVREVGVKLKGAFVQKGSNTYRIPSPIFEILEASKELQDEGLPKEKRFEAIARLHELVPQDEPISSLHADKYFGSIRVLHASAFSIQIPSNKESFQINPVLFSRKATDRADEEGRILDEAENILTDHQQNTFANSRFKKWESARDCYAIENGVYVYVDRDLKQVLDVVREVQELPPEDRKTFICSPQKYIREKLGASISEEIVEHIFVETEQYAANVVGLGIWEEPVIPWLVKEPNTWLPEKFGLKIGEIYVQIKPDDVVNVREQVEEILKKQNELDDHQQQTITYDGIEIPATKETLAALDKINGIAVPEAENNMPEDNIDATTEVPLNDNYLHFLIVEDNIDDLRYTIKVSPRAKSREYIPPVVLKSTLKKHQEVGFKWLIDAWADGAPGVLLADDMGLGKTMQALAFLAWIKERKLEGDKKCKEPILIVAPSGLLNNWQKEIKLHLREPYLGDLCEAYGSSLSSIRVSRDNDIGTGVQNINRDILRQHDVILTTYETYRDYHHSFGGIRFSAVIMDECQKIKNPKSQVNRAFASMNAEFVVAMTGTPVENALEDLWSILDRVWPGFLGDLKTFSQSHSPDNHESLILLKKRLMQIPASQTSVPIIQRRMKEEILDDIPSKHLIVEEVTMPPEQAEAYMEVIGHAKAKEPPPMLFTLHRLRGVSLHPIDPSTVLSEANFSGYDDYIAGSARLKKTIEILDSIKSKNEKALIFIETIAMQQLMADIIKKRYGLKKRPDIINGKTGQKIQRLVDEFQNDPNFDVMILSPKVGGVGLTLTAANHVIHLSRWWNPAIEDQSTDRAYRIGQTKDVYVYCPLAVHPDTGIREHSFDLKLNALLESKRELSRNMLAPYENAKDTENLFNETVGFSNKPDAKTIEELDRLDGVMFENWALNTARENGYQVNETKQSHDHGADGIITHKKSGNIFILQCKHSTNDKISQDQVINDLLRARSAYNENAELVALTNSYFSDSLIQRMELLKIKYFDRSNITSWPQL